MNIVVKHLFLCSTEEIIHLDMKTSFQNAINAKCKKNEFVMPFCCVLNLSLLHQCFMPNRYISLFKMYLTLLTSQRGALATDVRSCSLWRSLLERPPPARETRVRDPLVCDVCGPGGV